MALFSIIKLVWLILVTAVTTVQSTNSEVLIQIAETQSQTAAVLAQVTLTQSETSATLSRVQETQCQSTAILTQIAEGQNQMKNAFSETVLLIQMQNQQLQIMTSAMNTMISSMEKHQESLENISQSIPNVLQLQTTGNELLNQQVALATNCCQPKTDESTTLATTPTTIWPTKTPATTNIRPAIVPTDCSGLPSNGNNPSGVYSISPTGELPFEAYCDMDTAHGGWTMFQRRYDGSVDFYLDRVYYERGFGSLEGEFWLGLSKAHQLTQTGSWVLRVDLEAFDGSTAYAEYNTFRIGNASSNYRLNIGLYQGNATDSLRYHDNMPFTTKDRDNDAHPENCAVIQKGAWWHGAGCGYSNLNGSYLSGGTSSGRGMWWLDWKGTKSLKRSELKMRRVR